MINLRSNAISFLAGLFVAAIIATFVHFQHGPPAVIGAHYNPIKHGYVTHVADWPYPTFHRFFARGIYPADWGEVDVVGSVVGEQRMTAQYAALLHPTRAFQRL